MEKITKVVVSTILLPASAFMIFLALFYYFKVPYVASWIIGGVIGAMLSYLSWRLKGAIRYLLLDPIAFWAVGFLLGNLYVMIFDNENAQGIFLAVLITGPVMGAIGLLYGIYRVVKERNKKEPLLEV